jgi:signal transduction histidine kinase
MDGAGRVIGARAVSVDVTEKVRAREAIEAERARLVRVLEQLPVGIFIARGTEGTSQIEWTYINPTGIRYTGSEDVPFGAENDIASVHYLDGTPLTTEELPLETTMLTGEPLQAREMILRFKNGDERVFLTSTAVISELEGRREAVLVSQDITEIKKSEAELARLYEEAQTALRLRDEFLTVASHELKTPITSIKAYAQLLKGKEELIGNAYVARGLRSIIMQSDRLAALIDDLLDVSRIEMGHLALEMERLELGELAREVVGQAQVLSDRHEISVVTSDISLEIEADRERIKQVLTNVLENGIKYSPEGGPVEVELRREGDEAVVTVCDHGIGIPADQLHRVFERFYRAPNASIRNYSGFGLGLHISREIVQRHGGRMWAQSTEGEGSRFSFALPLAGRRTTDDVQKMTGGKPRTIGDRRQATGDTE